MQTPFTRRGARLAKAGLALAVFALSTMTTTAQQPGEELADPRLQHVPGELLIGFKQVVPAAEMPNAARRLGLTPLRSFPTLRILHCRLPAGVSVERALADLPGTPLGPVIRFAEPNYLLHATDFPNDPRRGDLYGLHNVGQTGGTLDADIDAPEAWEVTTGSAAVVVGVIDTGIDYTHPDLAANIWVNPGEDLNSNGVADDFNGQDDDGNGKIDDLRGWDFVNNDNDPMDDNSHGTHVAGTIGAIGNNGIGVVGVSRTVRLMPLKFLNAGGSGSTANAIAAIQYAASKGVRITSNSWGGGQRSNALQDAIAASGALFVAAAGNGATSSKMYPAGYDLPNILSVAATDSNDALASFSNYSATWVDLAAPGVDTLSTILSGGYGLKSGTSMATPHVSGCAALVLAQNPGWTNDQVKAQLMNTVDPKPGLAGKCVTGGRLNARQAVGAPEFPLDSSEPDAVTSLIVLSSTPDTLTLQWTATGDDGSE